jgi:hypothetical protein
MKENPMIRRIASLSFVACLSAVSALACEKPGATEQQRETKAVDQAETAQAQADKNIATARVDFEKAREDYRHGRFIDLADLDKKIVQLQADQRTATGKTKADLDEHMPAVLSQREAFARDLDGLNTATTSTWDGAKMNVDREWDALKTAVSKAK